MNRGSPVRAARLTVLALTFGTVFGSIARADLIRHVDPLFIGGATEVREECQRLTVTRPSRGTLRRGSAQPSAATLAACLDLVRSALMQRTSVPEAAEPNQAAASDRRLRQLLGTYRAVEQLEPWVAWSDASQTGSFLTLELASLKATALEALAAARVVGPKYGVVIEGGAVEAEGGGDLGQSVNAPRLGTTSAFARLEIETAHIGIGAGWDAGLGFQVAWQPMLTMTRSATSSVIPAYRDGFTTSQSFRFARASSTTETAIVGRVGATRLSLAPVLDRSGNSNQSFAIADNGIAEWALVFDAGVDFRWYNRDVWLEHLTAQTLAPLVDVHVGLRHDQRFHRAGDLSEFDDPTGRLVFGFMVNPIRLTDRGAGGIGNTRLTFGGGFDFEGALRGPTRLPSGFRIFLAGRLDLPRARTARK